MIDIWIDEQDEVSGAASNIIRNGSVVELKITTDGVAQGQDSMMWQLEVAKPLQYAGIKIGASFLPIKMGGQYTTPASIARAKTAMKYALENTYKVLITKEEAAEKIKSYKDFSGCKVFAKLKIVVESFNDKQTGEKVFIHKNKVDTFVSPRPSSRTYPMFESFLNNDGIYEDDFMPELPNKKANDAAKPNNVLLDDNIPF
jgi:hypothetical protein